jgi:hypothetical protein
MINYTLVTVICFGKADGESVDPVPFYIDLGYMKHSINTKTN